MACPFYLYLWYSFEKCFVEYGQRFPAKFINETGRSGSLTIDEKTDAILDGRHVKLFAEATTFLTIINGVVTVGQNAKPEAKGHIGGFNLTDEDEAFVPRNSSSAFLHTHTYWNDLLVTDQLGVYNRMYSPHGSSSNDYNPFPTTGPRNVVVDNNIFIYFQILKQKLLQ